MNTLNKYLSILLFLTAFFGVSQEKINDDTFTYKKVKIEDKSQITKELKGVVNLAPNSESNQIIANNDGNGKTLGLLSVTKTGAAQYSIPIALPPGINGVVPDVSLIYNSQNGDGIAGYGWNVSGVSQITRLPATKFHDNEIDAVDFDRMDRFALDGQRLILKSGTYGLDAEYQTEKYSNLKITSHGNSPYAAHGPKYFLVKYPDGSVAKYGGDINSRTELVYTIKNWKNAQGLTINYQYLKENNTLSISKITYGRIASSLGPNEINFLYDHEPDRTEQAYVKGSSFIKTKKITSVVVKSHGEIYRGYRIEYGNTSLGYSRVKWIYEYSRERNVRRTALAFNYDDTAETVTVNSETTGLSLGKISQLNARTVSLDFNGNGKMDFLVYPKDTKNKFWFFKDIQSGATNYHYEVNTGRFETIFPSNLLSHNNKVLPGQGLIVVQNNGTRRVDFKSYANSISQQPMVFQYTKSWNAPTFNYDHDLNISEQKRIGQRYVSGDFNGDGLTDVLAIGEPYKVRTCSPTSGSCPGGCFICNSYTVNNRAVNFIDLKRNINTNPSNLAGNLQQALGTKDRVLAGDFNGDGKTDIMHVSANKIFVYGLDNNNKLELLWSHNEGVPDDFPVLLGDYNGDGKTDYVVPIQAENSNFRAFLSTGRDFKKTFFWAPFKYKKPENPSGNVIYSYNLIPLDINGDGRTDIVEHNTITNTTIGEQEIKAHNNLGFNSDMSLKFSSGGNTSKYGNVSNYPIPIFLTSNDPNKELDFATISDKWITSFSFNKNHKEDVLIRSIKSNGVEEVINYGNLDSSISKNGLYLYQNTADDNYPYANITVASGTKLVSSIKRVSPGSPTLKQEFAYYDAVYNVEGLGFIGFKGFAESNWHTGISDRIFNISKHSVLQRGALTEQYSIRNYYSFFVPNSGYITKTVNQNSFTLSEDKVFTLRNNSSLTQNSVDGTYTNVVYQYDTYNNPKKITTNYSGESTHVLDITYENSLGSNYYIGRPIKQIETKTIGSETFRTTKVLSYSGYLLTKKQTYGNGTHPDTEDYLHDVFGNLIKKTVTPYNTPPRIIQFKYDTSGRFLEESIDVEGQVTTYQYNINSGTLKSETNPQGLKTRYEYDSWHRPRKVIDYLGKTISTEYSESSSHEYTVKNTGEDGTGSITVYDRLNRVKTKQEKDVLGKWVKMDYQYDKFDRVKRESEPYTGTTPTQWNATEYDFYGRAVKQKLYTGRVITMDYNGLSVTVDDGVKTVKTTSDAIGNTKRVTDPGGTIDYTYFGNGNLKTANYGGTIVKREQDGWGRKTKLIDPSAGTYEYEYNGFGEVTKEKTPKGETNYVYSSVGKLEQKSIIGDQIDMKVSYDYNANNKLLNSITMTSPDNSSVYGYAYDNLHRLVQTHEKTPYAQFFKKITYDDFGRIDTEHSYAKLLRNNKFSSKKIKNSYQNGALKTITDSNSGELLWSIEGINSRGQATKVTMGNNLTEESVYSPLGYLKENLVVNNGGFTPEQLMKLTTSFNSQRGTLNSRSNSLFSWSEAFQYDNLDRLISFNDNDTDNEHTYDDSGRIKTSNIVGDYNYTGRAYQVKDITLNTQGDLYYQNNSLQKVSYNAIKKPVEIYEAGKEKVSFDYNAYLGRSNRFYGDTQEDKLLRSNRKHYSFDGTMEISYDNNLNKTTFITYVGGDAYNASAIWKSEQHGNNGGTTEDYYYLYRDYLGSIMMISDGNGNIKEKRHFDAWGNIVKVADGDDNALETLTFLDRGYTGHEHLQGVNLIHMNGRLYDPKLRRFLAPDNHIQDPYNTQSFNRYGYAWNNPLMYTDLNGEFIVESVILSKILLGIFIASAAVGTYAILDAYLHEGSDSSSSPTPPTQVNTGNNNNSFANVQGYMTQPDINYKVNFPIGLLPTLGQRAIQDNNLPILQANEVINTPVANGNQIDGGDGFSITASDIGNTVADFVPLVGGVNDIRLGLQNGSNWQVALGFGSIILDVFTLGSASLIKGVVKTGIKQSVKRGLFRKAKNIGDFSKLNVPMRRSAVRRLAKEGGVGLKGVRIRIDKRKEFLNSPFFGHANKNTITLFPNAFESSETLIRTLGHERTHIQQFKIYGQNFVENNSRIFENAAINIEDSFIKYWRN